MSWRDLERRFIDDERGVRRRRPPELGPAKFASLVLLSIALLGALPFIAAGLLYLLLLLV